MSAPADTWGPAAEKHRSLSSRYAASDDQVIRTLNSDNSKNGLTFDNEAYVDERNPRADMPPMYLDTLNTATEPSGNHV